MFHAHKLRISAFHLGPNQAEITLINSTLEYVFQANFHTPDKARIRLISPQTLWHDIVQNSEMFAPFYFHFLFITRCRSTATS